MHPQSVCCLLLIQLLSFQNTTRWLFLLLYHQEVWCFLLGSYVYTQKMQGSDLGDGGLRLCFLMVLVGSLLLLCSSFEGKRAKVLLSAVFLWTL